MEMQEFIDCLLKAADVPEVKQKFAKIMQVISEDEKKNKQLLIQELEETKTILETQKKENLSLQSKIKEKEKENKQLLQEKEGLKKDCQILQEEIRDCKENLNYWESLFDGLYNILATYQALSPQNKDCLKGIFKSERPEVFIAAGAQLENIAALWEYVKMQIMSRKYENIKEMSRLVYYFIRLYNQTRETPVLKLQDVTEGDLFDAGNHIRTSDSKASGKIQKIYLYGYEYSATNAIVKRSVVMVS